MAISLNGGTGVITGVSVGGLPDGIVDTDMLAAGAVTAPKRGAGAILQVQQTHLITGDSQSLTSGTRAEISNLSVSITPKQSTSDMMVFVRWNGEFGTTTNYNHIFGVRRDSTDLGNPAAASNRPVGIAIVSQGFFAADANSTPDSAYFSFLDTTRTSGTSQITYKATVMPSATGTQYNQRTVADLDGADYERLTSTIIVMEVAA